VLPLLLMLPLLLGTFFIFNCQRLFLFVPSYLNLHSLGRWSPLPLICPNYLILPTSHRPQRRLVVVPSDRDVLIQNIVLLDISLPVVIALIEEVPQVLGDVAD